MALVLGHNSARRFWRTIYPANRTPALPSKRFPDMESGLPPSRALRLAPSWAIRDDEPLHAIVFGDGSRRNTSRIVTHLCSGRIPDGSFYRIEEDLFVSSPAFTFLQLATQADIRELVAFGNELCGLYSFDETAGRGFRTRSSSLITKRSLEHYVGNASGCRGHRKALQALRSIVDRAASPMESTVEMLACLPCNLGGYGLEAPCMNFEVDLDEQAALIAGRKRCIADICYPSVKLDIEYHGRRDHEGREAFDSDRARVNGLREMGYEVIELTFGQVSDFDRFEELIRLIARRTGKRIRRENLGALPARIEARRLLFGWNRRGGEPAPDRAGAR